MSKYSFGSGIPTWNGVPMIGSAAGRFAGLWSGKIWFVDGRVGSDGNSGKAANKALKTIAKAIALAGTDDTIYVRPQAVGVRYTENLTVPVATHAGLSIIGTGNGHGFSVYQACSIKGVTGVTLPTLLLDSSYNNVENMHFWGVAAQVNVGPYIMIRWNTAWGVATSTGLNIGSSIVNCSFAEDPDHPDLTHAQVGVLIDSSEGHLIEGCKFHNVPISINILTSQSITDSIAICGNEFNGTAANMVANIQCAGSSWLSVNNNTFGHTVPAGGGAAKYIYCSGTTAGEVMNNSFASGGTIVIMGTDNTLSNMKFGGNVGTYGWFTS